MQRTDPEYSKLLQLIKRYLDKGRTESHAFLNWFIENIYRLDDTAADDCICDKPYDKGFDAIYVDQTAEEIHIFQSKTAQDPKKRLCLSCPAPLPRGTLRHLPSARCSVIGTFPQKTQ